MNVMNKSFCCVVIRVSLLVTPIALAGMGGVEAGQEGTSSTLNTTNKQAPNVLPFVNQGSNPESDWIGVGIADTISAVVDATWGGREVRPTLSENIGVTGSYELSEGQLQITAKLIKRGTAEVVSAFSVGGTIEELFQLQDQIASWVVSTLLTSRADGVGMSSGSAVALSETESTVRLDGPLSEGPVNNERERTVAFGGFTDQERATGVVNELFTVEPPRSPQPPVIDGILDEPAWADAAVIEDFTQQEPNEGEPATERTIVRLMYDSESLYIAMEAHDSIADGVIATEMRRDSFQLLDEDNFQIILDTFNDNRSGYMFVTSPLGAKLEQQISEEGEGGYSRSSSSTNSNVNVDWDGVWNVSTQQTGSGWVAEIEIPMVTMRFPKTDRQVWGLNFMRNIRRKNEQVYWAPVPKGYELMRVSRAGTLLGLAGIDRGMDLRITPYVLGAGRQDRNTAAVFDGSGLNDVGVDVKYGIAAGLNLDLTLNTDFAQVEVDEQQVNLTRFPLFFPEKRDFFLENAGMFSVKSQQSFGRVADLFFTRRIGLANGQPVPIIGGTRLTGKVQRHNVAVMNIQTQAVGGQLGENFFVGRYSRDIFARSKVGGIVVNKEAIGGSHFNRTIAVDTSLTPHPFLSITGFVAKTESPQVTRDDMMGHMMVMWLSPSARIYSEYSDIQDNFNAEVGFVPRLGIRRSKLHGQWNPRPGRWGIRSMDPMLNVEYTTDQANRLLTRRVHHMMGIQFEDGSSVTFITNKMFEQLDVPFQISQNTTIPVGTYRFWQPSVFYRSDPSQRVSGNARYSPQGFFGGRRVDWGGGLNWRATSRIAAQASFRRSDVTLPGGAFVADLASTTFDLALSPEMTLRSLIQYNSTTDSISTSVRFNWIYKPGSDIYIAYDELRTDDFLGLDPTLRHNGYVPWIQNRQLAIKMTYLLAR